jgi:organic radical activating enzyme
MFGKNPVRKPWLDAEGRLAVQAIFPTIQGEGPYAGRPAIFIRLAGCNLRCWFCDTDFESKIDNMLSVAQIMQQVRELGRSALRCSLVVLTGGEPLRQNALPLIDALDEEGYIVQIETAGTLWLDGLEHRENVAIVCSPKTPKLNEKVLIECEHYKYIIDAGSPRDSTDGLPYATTQQPGSLSRSQPLARPPFDPDEGHIDAWGRFGCTIWLQPCDVYDAARNLANLKLCAELCMKHGYRLSVQLHKLAGLE